MNRWKREDAAAAMTKQHIVTQPDDEIESTAAGSRKNPTPRSLAPEASLPTLDCFVQVVPNRIRRSLCYQVCSPFDTVTQMD